MKSSIRFFTGFILAYGLSGWLSSVSASQPIISISGKSQPSTSFKVTEYADKTVGSSILLKWPQGSLIFPEDNDPNQVDEVFLLGEASTSQSELQPLYYHLGLQFFSRNKYNEAKAEYWKALKFKPNAPVIYKNLGLIYFNSRNYRRAERAYRKALQLDPGYTIAIAKLALSLAAQKKYTSAEIKFKQAIRAEPSNADHYLNLGHFYYYLKKNYRGAKYSYRKALKLNPRLIEAKNNLRDINRKYRKWKDLESNFENSWGSDFDYNSSKNTKNPKSKPDYSEKSDLTGTWKEENKQNPLF
jgi:tetratricopeptide (TPR) repeat protein